ncbi:hypothetical protein [Tardiphaga sp.]|jgi:hypothetical protein|uniref:hypothetical protein n=1 Tax=Tardiphaga sp. TaxID=1926292 RepID=UPI0037D9A762
MTEELSKAQRWGQFKARFWSVIGSLLAFCFVFILGGIVVMRFVTDPNLSVPLAAILAIFSATVVYVLSMKKKSRYATCPSCSAPFSMVLVDRDEQLITAVPRQTVRVVSHSAKDGTPQYQHDTWVAEFYRVTDTVECDQCGEKFERKYNKEYGSGATSSTDW